LEPPISARAAAVFFALLVSADVGHATSPRFQHLGLEDGLSQATVNVSFQDSLGFMWFGTQEGLNRFDGYEFTVFQPRHDSPSSISHDFVRAILETSDGVLWIGTDGGLNRLHRASDSFEHFRHDPDDPQSLSDDRIRALIEDEAGRLLIGTDGGGLNRFNPRTGRFEQFIHDPSDPTSLSGDRVRDVLLDRSGAIWVATDGNGLNRMDPETGTFQHFQQEHDDPTGLQTNRVTALFEDTSGTLWIGTYDAGVYLLDRTRLEFEHFAHEEGEPGSLSADGVRSIFQDSTGRIWLGTDAGINEWDPSTRTWTVHRHNPTDRFSLKHDRVTSVYEDRGGVLWVGTYAGLSRWNLSSAFFRHYRHDAEEEVGLSNNWVSVLAQGEADTIWVGTYGGGLNQFDAQDDRFVPVDPILAKRLANERVMSILEDSRGTLWIGTLDGGLNEFDTKTGRFRIHKHDPGVPGSISADGVTTILEDRSNGELWFGTYVAGLNRFDRSNGTFQSFQHDPEDPSSLSSNRVLALHQDKSGKLWIGTDGAGVNVLDPVTLQIQTYQHIPDDTGVDSLSNDRVWTIAESPRGDLWFGTRGDGLNLWRSEDRAKGLVRFHHVGENDGLPNLVINASTWDDDGNLWVSTNRGLSRLDPTIVEDRIAIEIANYDETHGLQSNEFNQGAGLKSRDGTLYFGGIEGFNSFRPREVRANGNVPPVHLTQVLVFNEPRDFSDPLYELEEIELKHSDVVIAFEFSALDYTAPAKNRYSYMLEGFDTDWVDSANLRRAAYTNLRPGEYRFRVRASNNDGVWNEEGRSLLVSVSPPPWRTWWAYCVYGLLLAAVIGIFLRFQAKKRRRSIELKRTNESLNREIREREARERELRDEKEKARNYLDVAQVILCVIDPEGRVALINQKGCDVLGYDEEEILGADWFARFVPTNRRAQVRSHLFGEEFREYAEYPVRNKEGQKRSVAWHSTRLYDDEGRNLGVLSSGMDVTRVRRLETQLLHTQKMDAIGTLAGGIAHDFNNILTAIIGHANLGLDELKAADASVRTNFEQVLRAGQRARDLVGQILTFSRESESQNQPVEIQGVLHETLKLIRATLPATIEIEHQIDPYCPAVLADPTKVHQVIVNLCTNAFHAMGSDRGVLGVRLERVDVDDEVIARCTGLKPGPHARLTISDTGSGIDSKVLERIFDPFFTTKGIGEGTGLGLSVVHGIVKSCRGDIAVTSQIDHGTEFEIYLPCSTERAVRSILESPKVAGGGENVLVVDDEEMVANVTAAILRRYGYQVTTQEDSESALKLFRDAPEQFDLVITDQTMPRMTGLELAGALREIDPDLPIVIASGLEPDGLDKVGIDGFVQKPFQASELAEEVRRALDRGSRRQSTQPRSLGEASAEETTEQPN